MHYHLYLAGTKVEDDYVELAKTLMEKAEAKGVKFLLPEDVVVADKVRAQNFCTRRDFINSNLRQIDCQGKKGKGVPRT